VCVGRAKTVCKHSGKRRRRRMEGRRNNRWDSVPRPVQLGGYGGLTSSACNFSHMRLPYARTPCECWYASLSASLWMSLSSPSPSPPPPPPPHQKTHLPPPPPPHTHTHTHTERGRGEGYNAVHSGCSGVEAGGGEGAPLTEGPRQAGQPSEHECDSCW